uniref:Uncharacterized protein n=1 Tax=Candidatus Kentrum sp. LFY TaxID=2126342 RepID=A0A450UKZ7_9GAMM|nr:MAG: hypothetical protein BECKLFY1418B_GA0070995_10433 [Candidatus Kentron sp. LFY]
MHKTTARFRCGFDALPSNVQEIARRNYDLLEENPRHPSLHFEKVCKLWSVRVGRGHSATKAATESCCRPWHWVPAFPSGMTREVVSGDCVEIQNSRHPAMDWRDPVPGMAKTTREFLSNHNR